jgi:hypothetical protein
VKGVKRAEVIPLSFLSSYCNRRPALSIGTHVLRAGRGAEGGGLRASQRGRDKERKRSRARKTPTYLVAPMSCADELRR